LLGGELSGGELSGGELPLYHICMQAQAGYLSESISIFSILPFIFQAL
jgi:hypothetical protein